MWCHSLYFGCLCRYKRVNYDGDAEVLFSVTIVVL